MYTSNVLFFFFNSCAPTPSLHSSPTPHSSDRRDKTSPPAPLLRNAPLPPCTPAQHFLVGRVPTSRRSASRPRSEDHTSELQSQSNLVCRLLLEKKKIIACV